MSAIAVASVKYVQHTFDWDAPAVQTPRSTTAVSTIASPEQTALRRGRCEHVGGVMAVVLSKYGLGIDDLLRAIEERQAQAKVPSR
jgi:hypothetical protein